MSRSIGDLEAHELGVTETPDIKEFVIPHQSDHMLIIASDGLWEHISNDEVMHMQTGLDVFTIPNILSAEAISRWTKIDKMVDDTTIVAAHIQANNK